MDYTYLLVNTISDIEARAREYKERMEWILSTSETNLNASKSEEKIF